MFTERWSRDHMRSNAKGLFLRLRAVRNCVQEGSSSLLAELYFWHTFYLVRVFRLANTHVALLVYLTWLKQCSAKFPGQNTDLFFWINKVSDISSSNSEQACLRLCRLHAAYGGNQRQFSENICSEDDLRSRIFRTFVVKFLACLPLLGFSNI